MVVLTNTCFIIVVRETIRLFQQYAAFPSPGMPAVHRTVSPFVHSHIWRYDCCNFASNMSYYLTIGFVGSNRIGVVGIVRFSLQIYSLIWLQSGGLESVASSGFNQAVRSSLRTNSDISRAHGP